MTKQIHPRRSRASVREKLAKKIHKDHPKWTMVEIEAQLTLSYLGIGPYAKIRERIERGQNG